MNASNPQTPDPSASQAPNDNFRQSELDKFNQLAQRGQRVTLNWLFDAEDDIAEEFGQELALDFTDLQVNLQAELAS